MAKYHVSSSGKPAICDAKIQCRLQNDDGSPSPHGEFNSMAEATVWAEKELEKQYGLFEDSADQADSQASMLYNSGINSDKDFKDAEALLSNPKLDAGLKADLQKEYDSVADEYDQGALAANSAASMLAENGIESEEDFRAAEKLLANPKLNKNLRLDLLYETNLSRKLYGSNSKLDSRASMLFNDGINTRKDLEEARAILMDSRVDPGLKADLKSEYRSAMKTMGGAPAFASTSTQATAVKLMARQEAVKPRALGARLRGIFSRKA